MPSSLTPSSPAAVYRTVNDPLSGTMRRSTPRPGQVLLLAGSELDDPDAGVLPSRARRSPRRTPSRRGRGILSRRTSHCGRPWLPSCVLVGSSQFCGKPRLMPPWLGSSQRRGDRLLLGEELAHPRRRGPWCRRTASPSSRRSENVATGTGIGTLMPIMPTSISFWKRRAAPPSLVKIAVPLPNALELMSSTPAS